VCEHGAKTRDESTIEIDESNEGLHLFLVRWSGPVCHSSDLDQIHFDLIVRDDDPQRLNLSFFELAFLGAKDRACAHASYLGQLE
jgi:hypothetical protein